jgi:hypothetical protein
MPKKQFSTPLLPIVIILVVIAGGIFFLFKPHQEIPVTPATPPQQGQTTLSGSPEGEDSPTDTTPEQNLPTPDEHGNLLRQAPMTASPVNPCSEASRKLDLFFTYLDEQDYIQKYQFPHDSKELLSTLINSLLDSPPVINGKALTDTDILRNTAHIYRTLGPQNLTILAKIMENEADLVEETCDSFQHWFTLAAQCLDHPYPLRPSLEKRYEYAVFFLETTGGRAYLNRRPGSLRLLGQYYSVLTIHQAQLQGLNIHDIKLAPILPLLIGEIEASDELASKSRYLTSLYDIREQLFEREDSR